MSTDPDLDQDDDRDDGAEAPATGGLGRGYMTDLAERLGVNRRTLYKWAKRGAPVASEPELRAWCKRIGARLRPPLDLGLPEMSPGAGSAAGAAVIPAAPTTPTTATTPIVGPDGKEIDGPDAELKRGRLRLVDEQTAVARNQRLEQERRLLDRDDVLALMKALGTCFIAELADLPVAAAKAGDLSTEQRRAVRRQVEQATETIRARLAADLTTRIKKLLTPAH
jgi:hypothetical protein